MEAVSQHRPKVPEFRAPEMGLTAQKAPSSHIQFISLQRQGLPEACFHPASAAWGLVSLTLAEGSPGVGGSILVPVEAQGGHQPV